MKENENKNASIVSWLASLAYALYIPISHWEMGMLIPSNESQWSELGMINDYSAFLSKYWTNDDAFHHTGERRIYFC